MTRYGKRGSNDEREMRIEHLRKAILRALEASFENDFDVVAECLKDADLVNEALKLKV